MSRAADADRCPAAGSRSPVIASTSSDWPLPSTPARPTISPRADLERRGRARPAGRGRRAPRGPRPRAAARRACAGSFSSRKQHVAADHQLGQARLGGALRVDRADLLAAPQHGDAVGDLEHLAQLVRDEDDRRRPRAVSARRTSNSSAVSCGGEHGGRLVEDQHLGAAVQRAQDLHPLLLADADVLDARARVDVQAEALATARARAARRRPGRAARPCAARTPSTTFSATVMTGISMKCWCTMPIRSPIASRGEPMRTGSPSEADLALVGLVEPVEDVHERRLARAVLPEQGVHLALAQVEVDAVVRDQRAEALGDALELEGAGWRWRSGRYCDRCRGCRVSLPEAICFSTRVDLGLVLRRPRRWSCRSRRRRTSRRTPCPCRP